MEELIETLDKLRLHMTGHDCEDCHEIIHALANALALVNFVYENKRS